MPFVVDQQRIEGELVRTKNFYKKITENLQSGVIVTDANGIMTDINNYMEKLIGVEAEKLIGTNQLEKKDILPPEALSQMRYKQVLCPRVYKKL